MKSRITCPMRVLYSQGCVIKFSFCSEFLSTYQHKFSWRSGVPPLPGMSIVTAFLELTPGPLKGICILFLKMEKVKVYFTAVLQRCVLT